MSEGPQPALLVVCGPTAAGKTALALRLAQRFDGEIVGADSRQVYRHMDIGTAKPTPAERVLVPHHLIDVAEPDEVFSLADYVPLARDAIDGIARRGRLPLLVGGTGLYMRALARGFSMVPGAPPRPELRGELEAQARRDGLAALYGRLAALDPEGATQIDARNIRRVVRALEIMLSTGKPLAQARGRAETPPYNTLMLGLSGPRDELYQRADRRVATMMSGGLLHEVEMLRRRGYDPAAPAMSSLGYREVGRYLDGTITLQQAVQATHYATHSFIRRQLVWFRREEGIHWFPLQTLETPAEAEALITAWRAGDPMPAPRPRGTLP